MLDFYVALLLAATSLLLDVFLFSSILASEDHQSQKDILLNDILFTVTVMLTILASAITILKPLSVSRLS